MRINGKYGFDDVGVDDLVAEATSWRLPAQAAHRLIASVVDRAAVAVDPLIEQAHVDKWHEPILDEVAAIIRANADRLTSGP